jgi:hypothetical protein
MISLIKIVTSSNQTDDLTKPKMMKSFKNKKIIYGNSEGFGVLYFLFFMEL